MSKSSSAQMQAGKSPAQSSEQSHSASGLLSRQHTLGPHMCVQREAADVAAGLPAPSLVREVMESTGQPLDSATRSAMEPKFGFDFSRVRLHTDGRAAESARAVGAKAFTAGSHIAFAQGQYAPGTSGGQRLMAHELAHVVQQASGPVPGRPLGGGISVSDPADPFEERARNAASSLTEGHKSTTRDGTGLPSGPMPGSSISLQRDTAGDVGAVAGVAGGVLALAALVVGLEQLSVAKHPPASASPSGGLTLNNAGSFNTLAQPAPGSDDSTVRGATPHSQPILYVDAPATGDSANNFSVGLQTKTDGHNIVDGFTQEEHTEGYIGGGDGATAQVTFAATPVATLAPSASPAPATPAAPAPATWGADSPGGAGTAGSTSAAAPPAAPASSPPAEVMLRFQGLNSAKGQMQRFKGAYRISGDGSIKSEKSECKVTQGDPADMEVADNGYISVGLGRTHSAKASTSAPAPASPLPKPSAAPATGPGDFGPEPPNQSKGVPV